MEPSITEVGSGWFLDRVDVTGPTGDKISFPCKTWLGKSDAGDFDGEELCLRWLDATTNASAGESIET